jgi:hypothetical protein
LVSAAGGGSCGLPLGTLTPTDIVVVVVVVEVVVVAVKGVLVSFVGVLVFPLSDRSCRCSTNGPRKVGFADRVAVGGVASAGRILYLVAFFGVLGIVRQQLSVISLNHC